MISTSKFSPTCFKNIMHGNISHQHRHVRIVKCDTKILRNYKIIAESRWQFSKQGISSSLIYEIFHLTFKWFSQQLAQFNCCFERGKHDSLTSKCNSGQLCQWTRGSINLFRVKLKFYIVHVFLAYQKKKAPTNISLTSCFTIVDDYKLHIA